MTKAKYDPLEAAKVAADGGKVGKAEKTFSEPPRPPAPPAPAAEPKEPPPAPPARPVYRVVETRKVSVGGQVVTMKAGRVIQSAGYGGEAGIDRLRAQGLKLEPA